MELRYPYRQVLGILRQHGSTSKPSKHTKVDPSEHVLRCGYMQLQANELENIMETRKPETKKESRSFLALQCIERYAVK